MARRPAVCNEMSLSASAGGTVVAKVIEIPFSACTPQTVIMSVPMSGVKEGGGREGAISNHAQRIDRVTEMCGEEESRNSSTPCCSWVFSRIGRGRCFESPETNRPVITPSTHPRPLEPLAGPITSGRIGPVQATVVLPVAQMGHLPLAMRSMPCHSRAYVNRL